MATVPPHVQPGQLILANHWNAMVDVLTEVKTIVDSLGVGGVATGPPVIVTIQPSEQPPIGTEITLIGSGFGVPIENTVTIASVSAVVLGGGGGMLQVRVPVISGVPVSGLLTEITVSNPRGFTSHSLRVMPAVLTVPEGQLFANMTTSPSGTINAGTTADFIFTLRAVVNIAETYDLTPILTPSVNPASWQAIVLDAAMTPITSITIPAGSPPTGEIRTVRVRVTIPAGSNGATCGLSLTVRSQRNSTLTRTSPTFTITVGAAAPPAEALTVTRSGGVINGTVDPDGTVACSTPQTRVSFATAGTANGVEYTILLGTIPSGWTASVFGDSTPNATGAQLPFQINFTPGVGAAAATFNLRVQRTSDATVFGTLALQVRPQ